MDTLKLSMQYFVKMCKHLWYSGLASFHTQAIKTREQINLLGFSLSYKYELQTLERKVRYAQVCSF